MDKKLNIYDFSIEFISPLYLKEKQFFKEKSVHPALQDASIETIDSPDKNWDIKSRLVGKYFANEENYTKIGKEIVNIILGLLGFHVSSGISFEQISIGRKDDTSIIVTNQNWKKGKITVSNIVSDDIKLDREDRIAIDWIGKGLSSIRPDDKFVAFYSAIESIIPADSRKATDVCPECKRPFPTASVKNFLMKTFSFSPKDAEKIIDTRGGILHGRISVFKEADNLEERSDKLLSSLREFYNSKFSLRIEKPDYSLSGEIRIFTKPVE